MRDKLDNILGKVIAAIMGIMVVNVLWQVITRFIGIPSSFTDELARYLMIWLGVLGAAYVSGKRMHVAIDLLSPKLDAKGKKRLRILVSTLISLFSFFALVGGGVRLVYLTLMLGQRSPALQIPLGLVYMIIPISGVLIIYYKLSDISKLRK